MPLHRQSRDVKASMLQSINISPQVSPTHLERLSDLAVEVSGGLGELWQRSDRRQPLVPDNRAIRKITHPAPFENPHVLRVRPARATQRCGGAPEKLPDRFRAR